MSGQIKLEEIFETKDEVHLILELVTGGELFDRYWILKIVFFDILLSLLAYNLYSAQSKWMSAWCAGSTLFCLFDVQSLPFLFQWWWWW